MLFVTLQATRAPRHPVLSVALRAEVFVDGSLYRLQRLSYLDHRLLEVFANDDEEGSILRGEVFGQDHACSRHLECLYRG